MVTGIELIRISFCNFEISFVNVSVNLECILLYSCINGVLGCNWHYIIKI